MNAYSDSCSFFFPLKMADLVDNMNGLSTGGVWSYRTSNWIPDAVLIVLGGNDLNEGDFPSEPFKRAILHLLNKVAKNYAHAAKKPMLFTACGNSGSRGGLDNTCVDMEAAVARFNKQTNTSGFVAHFKDVTQAVWYRVNGVNATADDDHTIDARVGKSKYNGCGSHYNFAGDFIVMNDFLPQFHRLLGW